jgi:peptide/nickel transport system substrate-binding protein
MLNPVAALRGSGLRIVGLLAASALAVSLLWMPGAAQAQARKDSAVLAMALEPPGLDPTTGAASAIAEVVLYNIFETLTKIKSDGNVSPLLAESWTVSPDLKTYTFKLRRDVKFQNGEPFNAEIVKATFARAVDAKSTNKDKATFANMESVTASDVNTIVIKLKESEPDFLFLMGQATAIIVDPKSTATNATQPVGTGPYTLGPWVKGSSLTLNKWTGYRNASAVALNKVSFRFISDPAAQVASLLSGDVDAFPRVAAGRSLDQFKSDGRFTVMTGGSRAKTILALNQRKKPLNDVRVRRAIAAAIDRKAVIEGAADGFGTPIGSHYVPGAFGFVDTTGVNPFDINRAKALLAEAGVKTPFEMSLKLPPPSYARQGGEVVAAQLAKIGIVAKIENVEWAQWLSGVYTNKNYDLTIISHVEPFDLGNYVKPNYYWQYESPLFTDTYTKMRATGNTQERTKLVGDLQRMLASDVANVFLYQPQWITVSNSKLKGLWKDMPLFVNDVSVLSWQ